MFFSKPKLNKYGWKKQLPDQRDKLFTFKALPLPDKIDLRNICTPIIDQGDLGCCTACSITGAVGCLDIKDGKKSLIYSRLFLYYNERSLEGTVPYDSGASLRDGIKTMSKQGVCLEALWPYNTNRFRQKPNSISYNNAVFHKAITYSSITDLNGMKQCLASGFPFVFGFTVYDSFESDQVASTGIVPMPQPNESVLGGHAVLAVGYDNSSQRFIVKNSWGTSWGIKGYFMMPYSYLSNPNLASDFWVIKKTVSE